MKEASLWGKRRYKGEGEGYVCYHWLEAPCWGEGEEMTEAEVVVVVIVLCCRLGQNSLHMLRPISEKKWQQESSSPRQSPVLICFIGPDSAVLWSSQALLLKWSLALGGITLSYPHIHIQSDSRIEYCAASQYALVCLVSSLPVLIFLDAEQF